MKVKQLHTGSFPGSDRMQYQDRPWHAVAQCDKGSNAHTMLYIRAVEKVSRYERSQLSKMQMNNIREMKGNRIQKASMQKPSPKQARYPLLYRYHQNLITRPTQTANPDETLWMRRLHVLPSKKWFIENTMLCPQVKILKVLHTLTARFVTIHGWRPSKTDTSTAGDASRL